MWIWYKKFTYNNYAVTLDIRCDNSGHMLIVSLYGGKSLNDRVHFSVRKLNCIININKLEQLLINNAITHHNDLGLSINNEFYSANRYIPSVKKYIQAKALIFGFIDTTLAQVIVSQVQPNTKIDNTFLEKVNNGKSRRYGKSNHY